MIDIREALKDDADFIIRSQKNLARETENLVLDDETLRKGVNAVFLNPSLGKYTIALLDGENAGCLLTLTEWSDWRNSSVLWIHSVFVEEQFRNKGIYKALYNYLKAKVEASPEFAGLRLYVDHTNLKAKTVYERLGMNAEHYALYEWMKS